MPEIPTLKIDHARALRCWAHTIAAGGRFISVADCQHVVPDARALIDSGTNDALTLAYAGHTLAYLTRGAEIGLPALRRAKVLNPNSVTVLCSSGWLHAYLGQFETALADIERALRLNPLDPNTGFVRSALGPILLGLGRTDEAIGKLEQAFHEAPGYGSTVFTLMNAYWMAGRVADARTMAERLAAIKPDITISGTLAVQPFKHPPYLAQLEASMRGCGLPE